MSGLGYVGKPASAPNEVANRLVTNTLLSAVTPNSISVASEITGLTSGAGATYASKAYVDSQDGTFSSMAYANTQDLLNVPASVLGAVNMVSGVPTALAGGSYGVARMDSSSKILAAQMPILGAGYVQGPYGITSFTAGTASNTPVKIADWNIGAISLSFQPWVFMQCFVLGAMSRPVIEVRIANSTTAVAYASSTLVAMGVGRSLYNDYSAVVVLPVPAGLGSTPVNLGPSYNCWLSAWMYDLNSNGITISSGGVASSAAILMRGAQ